MTDLKRHMDAPPASDRARELGYGPMDAMHAEFDELLQRRNVGTTDWLPLLTAVDQHLREHFALEDRWMIETDFPPRECHMNEHAAVLKSSTLVLDAARQGDLSHARGFVAELSRWFPGHADYLDSAVAAWMCKRQYGGMPVVVHRSSASGNDTLTSHA
jgi:hemerythrin